MVISEHYEAIWVVAQRELKAVGIAKSSYHPPILTLYRSLGWQVRPPHYNSFLSNIVLFGLPFGIMMFFAIALRFVGLHFLLWISLSLLLTIVAGLLFGLGMAGYYKFSAYINRLSTWEELALTAPLNARPPEPWF